MLLAKTADAPILFCYNFTGNLAIFKFSGFKNRPSIQMFYMHLFLNDHIHQTLYAIIGKFIREKHWCKTAMKNTDEENKLLNISIKVLNTTVSYQYVIPIQSRTITQDVIKIFVIEAGMF